MAEERTPRHTDDREADERTSDRWIPQGNLPTPDPQDGWTFRWIRTSSLGNSDNPNVSKKMREGWIPVKAEDHPELHVMSDIGSRYEGNVEIGGLLLCKMPTEMVDQRTEHYQKVAKRQMESVDNNFMRENDPRMPLFNESESRTEFGKG